MARRQNKKINIGTDLPKQITKIIPGLDKDANDFINALLFGYRFGHHLFGADPAHHEDWVLLFVILANHAEGRATVTKNIVEMTGRAYSTVRTSLERFEKLGFIEATQRIGRSELYVPTEKMKTEISAFATTFWSELETLRPTPH
ncbi:MAG: hypothetical protein HAW65_03075 [Alphaproteobacteria bacterium]|nr:hypothetical protein [Alphaproteobacteria bacterium]